jgi:hypothetical protein
MKAQVPVAPAPVKAEGKNSGAKGTKPRRRPGASRKLVRKLEHHIVTDGLPESIQDWVVKLRTRKVLPANIPVSCWDDFAKVYDAHI